MKRSRVSFLFYLVLLLFTFAGCTYSESPAPLQANVGVFQWVIYTISKFIGYSIYCGFGLYYLKAQGGYSRGRAIQLGFYRLLLGAIFGSLVLIIYGGTPTSINATDMVSMYGPIRVIEWAIIIGLMEVKFDKIRTPTWIFFGILVSFAIDFLAIPGKFLGVTGFRLC